MKFLFSTLLVLAWATVAPAQTIWVEPAQVDPNQPVKLYVNVALTTCPNLGNGDVYLWTWMPSESLSSGGNGAWDASNPAHKMTNEGNNIWSFTFPSLTSFYNVTPAQITGLAFLVKRQNGVEAGVCTGEAKSEDFFLPLSLTDAPVLYAADDLDLFPNPTSDRLTIAFSQAVPADDYTVELIDGTGRIALRQAWTGQPLYIGALATGQYLVRITGEAGVWAKRIVKE